MGMILVSLAVLAMLAAGALLTARIEPRLLGREAERGPAVPFPRKSELRPHMADRWLFPAGPITALIGVSAGAVVIPWGPAMVGADLGIGLFYFIVMLDFVVLGLGLTGWGANTRNSVEVYYRVVAQLVAYVVPLGLAYIGAIMMARSMSTLKVVEAQSGWWFAVLQPIGFAIYLVTGLMQSYRAPFLEPFSKHIDHGIASVCGGWQAIVWRLALSGILFLVAAMGAVLYLGGWSGPWLPGPVWMLLKTFALMALMVWLGGRFRPLSTARMLELSWKVLTPVGLLNVLVVGGLILLGVGP